MLQQCDRFGCLPSALEAEDTRKLVRLLYIEELGGSREQQPEG